MKLDDLIGMLAGEIDSVRPQLNEYLDQLAVADANSDVFSENLDLYDSQLERMGEAADMVGFSGLLGVCEHLHKNTEHLKTLAANSRNKEIDFLREWPTLMVNYLNNLDDPSVAAGLIDTLRDAPVPMPEENCMRVMHQLGALPAQSGLEDEESNKRPVLASDEDVALIVPNDVDPKLMDGFLQEAPDQVSYLMTLIGNIVKDETTDSSDIIAAKRVVHTLKGTGATIGIVGLANLGHHFEDILEYFEQHTDSVPEYVRAILLDATYCFEQMIGYISGQDDYPTKARDVLQDVLDLANRIDRGENLTRFIRRGQSAGMTGAQNLQQDVTASNRPATSALRIHTDRIDELFRVSAEVSVHTSAMEAKIKQLSDRSKALLAQHLRVKKRLYELETVVDVRTINMMRSMSKNQQNGSFDALEMEQYNELHSTSHAMAEDSNDAIVLAQHLNTDIAELNTLQTRQQVLAQDLQHLVIGTRMAEVGTLEPRLQRNIRTTCQTTGKQAVLTLRGGGTLIDTDVLNRLSEPLLHLLRNAVDHGLETPEERLDAGKDDVGSISLNFSRQGQQVVLQCQDDGRGLDFEKVKQRGIDKGLISADDVQSKEDIAKLVLMPGFSTRDEVSEVSGRGVGLDVVAEWARTMNGDVKITSDEGQGTLIEMRFSASLSTNQALIVKVSEQAFALSATQVEQALSRGVGKFIETDDALHFHYERQVIVARFLADLVGLPRVPDKPLDEYSVVIVNLNDERYALAVDVLVDSRELLVKDPGRYSRHLKQVAGVSILGDGSVTAHLDLVQMIGNARGYMPVAQRFAPVSSQTEQQATKVLIVDDSLSVRNMLEELAEDMGFIAKTARDGIEAIDVMSVFSPDLVLTDLEMPNMNGVELTMHIRNREDLGKVPIIMITSRSQNKHRELAVEAGVDEYVTKPYNEAALLGLIDKVMA